MDEKKIIEFVDVQLGNSWMTVETKKVNGRTVSMVIPSRRGNYENLLIQLIDNNRINEKENK